MQLCSMQWSYLQQVGNFLANAAHGARAAERSIGSHMDALLVAPLNHALIPEVGMNLHLHQQAVTVAGCIRSVDPLSGFCT